MLCKYALKEWAVAVSALEKAETIVLLRKGGIRESGGNFEVKYRRVLLYSTYEHQKPDLLKSDYAGQVEPVASGWHPETVRIGSWAEITDILAIAEAAEIERLLAYHIWNEQFVSDRLKWKPRRPVYVLLLRTYNLYQPFTIPYDRAYGGCQSWIDLEEEISLADSIPVLEENEYRDRVEAIRQAILDQSTIA